MSHIIERASMLRTWQFIVLFVIMAEVITAFMSILLSIAWSGSVSSDLLKIGAIDALVAGFVVSCTGIYLIRRNSELTFSNRQLLQEIVFLRETTRSITERQVLEEEKDRLISELQGALSNVNRLSGMLPICSSCKKIRDDKGYWTQIEAFIREHSEADFSHGICPECARKQYPHLYDKVFGEDPPGPSPEEK